MSETVIEVDKLSKLYRLGTIGSGSLRRDLQYWWTTSVLKKQHAYFQLANADTDSSGQFLWALKDVSFDVKKGDAIGIIGSNGSGKSTLLKIISRIVRPTAGSVKGRGKISSLLEVGTGFNAELTGRQNIFTSGYILGMNKAEITRKFDEIVDFSGIERFIDTPVKRYSSGMYVRLAFAVAAHLEPEILIVDEVLAVGDADFQRKCLGKMKDVSDSEGRTILFVSHSMQAVNTLCNRAIWLQGGKVKELGAASDVAKKYISSVQQSRLKQEWQHPDEAPGTQYIKLKYIELIPHLTSPDDPIDIRTPFTVKFEFWNFQDNVSLNTGLVLYNYDGDCIFDLLSPPAFCNKGVVEGECQIPGNLLNDGAYYFSLNVVRDTSVRLFDMEECISFEIEDYREDMLYFEKWWGAVRPKLPYVLKQKEANGLTIKANVSL